MFSTEGLSDPFTCGYPRGRDDPAFFRPPSSSFDHLVGTQKKCLSENRQPKSAASNSAWHDLVERLGGRALERQRLVAKHALQADGPKPPAYRRRGRCRRQCLHG